MTRSFPQDALFRAATVRLLSKDFVTGWANGLVRWHMRRPEPMTNNFSQGSIKYAASEAAVTFMRERTAPRP